MVGRKHPCVVLSAFAAIGLSIVLFGVNQALGAEPAPTPEELLKSGDLDKCKEASDAILQQRRQTIQTLLEFCDPKYPNDTRAAAMYTLGQMRAVEALPVLVKNIEFVPKFGGIPGMPRVAELFGYMPAAEALLAIGNPSVKPLLTVIATSERLSERQWAASLIRRIDGFDSTASLLANVISYEKDPVAKERLAAELAIIQKQIKDRAEEKARLAQPPQEK